MSIPNASSRAYIRHRASYDTPQPNGPEAIAMRRIVAEMGYWLSPLLKDHPVPVLTEWEATVDLTKLHLSRGVAPKSNRQEAPSTPSAPPANRAGRERAYSTPSLKEVEAKRHGKRGTGGRFEPVEKPAEPDEHLEGTPAPPATAKATPGAASPLSKPLSPEAKAAAIANIAARAAEQAAKEAAIREEKERRAAAKAARDSARQTARHSERMKTDPAYAEAYRLKRKEWEKARHERRKAKAAAKKAKAAEERAARKLANAEAIAAKKAAKAKEKAAAKKARHKERMATDPAYAAHRKELEKAAHQRKQERIRAMARAFYGPLPTAKELVAEAKTAEVAAEEARLMKIYTKARKEAATPKGDRQC